MHERLRTLPNALPPAIPSWARSLAVSKPTFCKYSWEFLHAPEISQNFLKFPTKIYIFPDQDCLPFAARRALVSMEVFLVKIPQKCFFFRFSAFSLFIS